MYKKTEAKKGNVKIVDEQIVNYLGKQDNF